MLDLLLETIRSIIQAAWDYTAACLTDVLLTTNDTQSFVLAVFVLGLLSCSVACLVFGLFHKRYKAHRTVGEGARWGGGGQLRVVSALGGGDGFGHRRSSGHGCISVGTSTGHRSKRWLSCSRRQRVSAGPRHHSQHSGASGGSGSRIVVSCREIPRTQPSLSCRSCRSLPAKRKCSYQQCGACCRANKSSICSAHGTGDVAALGLVDLACDERPLELDLSYMNLKCCPQMIGYIGRQLTILNLSNNRLVSLPDEIGLLGGLEQLFLQYNCLEKLPKCIGNFSHLQELDCKNNRLQSLPETLGRLSALGILNVTNNLLTELSPAVGQLIHLEELCAHSNQLHALPDQLCNLVNLTALYIGENPLRELPTAFGQLVRLTELDLSSCELNHLPASLSRCTSLNKVWLSNNRLRSLPDQIGRLHQLKELHIRNNCLEYFPASLSYLQLYTFSVNQDRLLSELDHEVRNQMTVSPKTNVPPLQELAARCIISRNVRWERGDLPSKLSDMLEKVRWCSCCEGPFFTYFSSELVFANVGIFHRVPLYQQICSPYYNVRCQPVTWAAARHNHHRVIDR